MDFPRDAHGLDPDGEPMCATCAGGLDLELAPLLPEQRGSVCEACVTRLRATGVLYYPRRVAPERMVLR